MKSEERREWVEGLNTQSHRLSSLAMIAMTHRLIEPGRLALVSSFGAEAAVLLHLVTQVDPDLPVLFIDTDLLFAETLRYQQQVSTLLGLTNIQVIRANTQQHARIDPLDQLHPSDPDACCHLRKTSPLDHALRRFDGWISGRKRFQGNSRANVAWFEVEPDRDKIKINPLANWDWRDVGQYLTKNNLPRHPLVGMGYPSIGCLPCIRRDGRSHPIGAMAQTDQRRMRPS
jgi:phosphoadenosine phosphosulfate reductase